MILTMNNPKPDPRNSLRAGVLLSGLLIVAGCASHPSIPHKVVMQTGRNMVWVERDPDLVVNAHPVSLSPTEVGTLLRGVRSWERRNMLHRLYAGQSDRRRTFRDEEIAVLAPPLSKALAQATASERVYFHLSHPTEQGDEETTTGWMSVKGSILYLSLSEAHDRHGPEPDIGKYDRQMPNIPELKAEFDATFEPEEYLVKVKSAGQLFAPDQREELQIRYLEALKALPAQPGLEQRK
ncbi:MAG: hypothetical protein NDI90_20740 [Nitrospira sp. BO4]|jgi:hypothetical protein|nr:hypothetical protein [Nitrospira sp. BO4]